MQSIGIVLIVLGLGWFTQTAAPDQSADLKTCTLKIAGMACEVCASNVDKVAKKIEGVKTVSVDQPKGVATISYDPAKTTAAKIAKHIQDKTSFKTEVQPEEAKK